MLPLQPVRHLARVSVLLIIGVGVLAFSMLLAGPVLQLTDGRELKGVDLRRDGDLYILVLANGTAIPVPSIAVKGLEWIETGDGTDTGTGGSAANVIKGRTDAEAQADEDRADRRESENEAWVANRQAEADAAAQQQQQQENVEWAQRNAGYIQPSGLVNTGWQQDVAVSTLQPTYWIPNPNQDIGTRPRPPVGQPSSPVGQPRPAVGR